MDSEDDGNEGDNSDEPSHPITPEPKTWEEMIAYTLLNSVKTSVYRQVHNLCESEGKLVNAASLQISKIQTKVSSAPAEDFSSIPNQKYPIVMDILIYSPFSHLFKSLLLFCYLFASYLFRL